MKQILFTNYEAAAIMQGSAMAMTTDYNQDIAVGSLEHPDPGGYVITHARKAGRPVVHASRHQLREVLRGRTVEAVGEEDERYVMRLYTPNELLEATDRAGDRLAESGLPRGPGMTIEDAMRLTQAFNG